MRSVKRSIHKVTETVNGNPKTTSNAGKALDAKASTTSDSATNESSSLRRSTRELSSNKQNSSSSSLNTRKSERLEKRSGLTPQSKSKSQRTEKQRMPSPSMRPEREEKCLSLSASSSKKLGKVSNFSCSKKPETSTTVSKKSEPSNTMVIEKDNKSENKGKPTSFSVLDAEKSEKQDCKSGSSRSTPVKKKRLDARSYRAYLNPKAVKQSDLNKRLRAEDNNSLKGDSENAGSSGCKGVETDVDEWNGGKGDESKAGNFEVDVETFSSDPKKLAEGTSRNDGGKKETADPSRKRKLFPQKVHESSNGDVPFDGSDSSFQISAPELQAKATKGNLQETLDAAEKVEVCCTSPTSASGAEKGPNIGALKRKRNTLDQDPSFHATIVSPAICTTGTSTEVISLPPSSNTKSKLSDICVTCSMPKGMECDSQNQEFCSCNVKIKNSKVVSKSLKETGMEVPCRGEFAEAEKISLHRPTISHSTVGLSVSLKDDRGEHGASDSAGVVEEHGNDTQQKHLLKSPISGNDNACNKCKLGGKLLCCDGKGCGRSYHLSCLNPPLTGVPFGTWHCYWCVKKKIEFGVPSISQGVESIWDVREEGVVKEKKYFVKYKGVAHVHNQWRAEKQLTHEAHMLLAKFNKKRMKEKAIHWKSEWTEPQRLLQKRLVIPPEEVDEHFGDEQCSESSSSLYEWLVKWKGLGYEYVTWELENAAFLNSPEAVKLIQEYESRHENAKKRSDPSKADKLLKVRKGSSPKLSKLPGAASIENSDDHLRSINLFLEYWHKGQNAFVIDNQERITKAILFILSLQPYASRPILLISTSSALPQWEAEFMHLAPSLNVVVYSGDKDVRKSIQTLEFFEEGGCVMFQVLLSLPKAIAEDLDTLECLGWEAVIVDECQRSCVLQYFNQIRTLTTDFKLLLANDHIRDSSQDYFHLLSFVDSKGVDGLNTEPSDSNIAALSMLKERLAHYLAYEQKPEKFLEYWVPVRLSTMQLEKYCHVLLDNALLLRSSSKNFPGGDLSDMLVSLRKCCDHPNLVDMTLKNIFSQGLSEDESLAVEINTSGKLQLLDKILPEMKNCGKRVLILFQTVGGPARISIGDVLDDYVRQKFGGNSYERVDSRLLPSKRQRALDMFNDLERGRFIFLLENRACRSNIKLTAVDTVVIFGSDWNPIHDLRALQKIHMDSEPVKVFRLYSSCTLEEKVLLLANQDTTLESNIHNINRTTSHMLLMWGASYLFDKLDDFHGCKSPCLGLKVSDDDIVQELVAVLHQEAEPCRKTSNISAILKVQCSGASYDRTSSLLGELEIHNTDEGTTPSAFWTKLLDSRVPLWRYLLETPQRPRKKAKYVGDLPEKPEVENEEIRRKRHKAVKSTKVDPVSLQPWIEEQKRNAVAPNNEVSGADAASSSQKQVPLGPDTLEKEDDKNGNETKKGAQPSSGESNAKDPNPGVLAVPEQPTVESEGTGKSRDAQKNLYLLLKPEIYRLCETLKLPEDVKHMAAEFLSYIINNHHVIREPKTILQAFLISLCWRAASLLKHKLNHKDSLMLAKKSLGFECDIGEAQSVYEKLRQPKKKFSHQMGILENSSESNSGKLPSSAPNNLSQGNKLDVVVSEDLEEGEIRDSPPIHDPSLQKVSLQQEKGPDLVEANSLLKGHESNEEQCQAPIGENSCKRIESVTQLCRRAEKCISRRKNEILKRQKKEIEDFNKCREELKEKMKNLHRSETTLVRASFKDYSDRVDKLKLVDKMYEKKLGELNKHMDNCHRELLDKQHEVRQKEERIKASWLEEAKSGRLTESFDKLPLSETEFNVDFMKISEQSIVRSVLDDTVLMSEPSLEPDIVPEAVRGPIESASASGVSFGCSSLRTEDEMVNMPSGVHATELEQHNREARFEDAHLVSSSLLNNIELPSSAEPPTDLGRDNFHLPHQVFRVEPNQPPTSTGVVENVELQTCQVNSNFPQVELSTGNVSVFLPTESVEPNHPPASTRVVENVEVQTCQINSTVSQVELPTSNISVLLPIEANQLDDPIAEMNEFRQSPHEVSSSQHAEVLIQSIDAPSHAEQLNHLEGTRMQMERTAVGPERHGALPVPSFFPMPSSQTSHVHPSTVVRQPQVLLHDPLHNEMIKIERVKDLVTRKHDEEKARLKSDCEREIEEVRRKYDALIQDLETRFDERVEQLDTNYKKVKMNRILGVYCCAKFNGPSRQSRQGSPSAVSLPQFPASQLPQTSQRPSQIPALTPPRQVVHNASALFSGNPAAPHFQPIIPRTNLQVGAELRAPAPHLHPFRPTSGNYPGPFNLRGPSAVPSQQTLGNLAATMAPTSHLPPFSSSGAATGTHLRGQPGLLPPINSSSLLALNPLMDVDSRVRTNPTNPLPFLRDLGVTRATVQSQEGSQAASTISDGTTLPGVSNVIYLSDDD